MKNICEKYEAVTELVDEKRDTLRLIFAIIGFVCAVAACTIVTIKLLQNKKKRQLDILDEVDLDGDGEMDALLVDTTGDGEADSIFVDTDGNGTIDTIIADTDGDGEPDTVYEVEEVAAEEE